MPRICLFPGSFDPITLGHTELIGRAADLFDQLVIGIGTNTAKQPMFSLEKRVSWCNMIYRDDPRVSVEAYEGLTIDFCKKIGASHILRGIRFVGDFEYEKSIADVNRRLDPSVETIFLTPSPELSTLASTLVREVIRYGGDATPFLPPQVAGDLTKHRPGGSSL